MSLYLEAASFLSAASVKEGSLKSRIFGANSDFKSNPATIYALVSECAKYDTLLTEVVDNAGILALEPKLTPVLSLLLVHDHLFAKRGIAAAASHPLRLAIERHKARLQAELTKSRIRRGYASIEDLKQHVADRTTKAAGGRLQPRWARVNHLKGTLRQQMSSTFSEHTPVSRLADLVSASPEEKLVYTDPHIPDLLALTPGTELSKTQAYKTGQLILQDKASCFPAFLLLGGLDTCDQGDVLDACAAPGNKTTHLASILHQYRLGTNPAVLSFNPAILACERDSRRSQTLQDMVKLAGAEDVVRVIAKQDFLALDPAERRFNNVTHLLLDPSCSGSGIVGRDDMPVLRLPKDSRINKGASVVGEEINQGTGVTKKRKRRNDFESDGKFADHVGTTASGWSNLDGERVPPALDFARLEKLANLQTKIIEHAFSFPAARRITYSTCSIHVQENEAVVSRVLRAGVATERGWRVMRQEEQPDGLRRWPHRGLGLSDTVVGDMEPSWRAALRGLREEERQACIRCHAGDEQGTMGFFVCGFIRDGRGVYSDRAEERSQEDVASNVDEGEWGGFSDSGEV